MFDTMISSALAVVIGMGLYATVPVAGDVQASYEPIVQDKESKSTRKTKRVQALSQKTGKKISKINEFYEAKDFASAMEGLMDLKREEDAGKLSGIDAATMWQYIGIIRYEQEDTNGTIEAYENFLKYKDDVGETLALQMQYGLGQLYFSRASDSTGVQQKADLNRSLEILRAWEKETPSVAVAQYFFIAQVYYIKEDFNMTLKYIDTVIKEAELANLEPQESWYRTRLSAYYELKNFEEVKNTLITLILNWSSPQYWWQLSSAYNELGNQDAFYALTEAIYLSGFFDKPNHYTMMAQIFVAQEVPIKAAWILEFALKKNIVKPDESTMKIIGQAYLMAQEYKKAVDPLSKAAEMAKDYRMWMQVGQIQQSLDNVKGALQAFEKALAVVPESKEKDKFTLTVLKGTALTEMRKYADAKKAFDAANKLASSNVQKKQMKQWFSYLDGEEKRWQMMQ